MCQRCHTITHSLLLEPGLPLMPPWACNPALVWAEPVLAPFVCVCVQFNVSGWGMVLMEPGLMFVSLWGPYTLFCSPYTSTIILSSYFRSTAELWPPAFLDMLTSTCPGKAEGSEGYHVLGTTPLHGQRFTGGEVDSGLQEHWGPQQLYKHNFSMQTCWDFFRRLSRENQNNPKEPPKHGGHPSSKTSSALLNKNR